MKRETYSQELARKLLWASEDEAQAKAHRSGLRDEFIAVVDKGFKGKEHILPVKTIEVPDEFFAVTGMTDEEFIDSRFPGWNVEHIEKNITLNRKVFVLKRDPSYLPAVVEFPDGEQTIRATKEVAEWLPEIDWVTLKQERPDLFENLAIPRQEYDLNEGEFERLMEESPEDLAVLERHMKVRTPTVKARVKRLKDA